MGAIACWVCRKPARGFVHTDLRFPLADPRRYPLRWAFCSRDCQNAFHTLYDLRRRDDPAAIEELLPVNFPLPPSAQHACVQALAGAAERVGFDVPLSGYSHPQVLSLIEAVLTAYEAALRSGLPTPTQPPPADFFDDIPFDWGHDAMTTDFLRRVVPSQADLLFFINGRESCVPDASTCLPDTDDPLSEDARWFYPVRAYRPPKSAPVMEVADA